MKASFVNTGQCVLLVLVHTAADPSVALSLGRIPRRLVGLQVRDIDVGAFIGHCWVVRGACAVRPSLVMTFRWFSIRVDTGLALAGTEAEGVMV
jgi:hypothetical protein